MSTPEHPDVAGDAWANYRSSDWAKTDAALLSELLWRAREAIEMWADVLDVMSGQGRGYPRSPGYNRNLVAEIDAYRAKQGWSPNGFGGERDIYRCRCGVAYRRRPQLLAHIAEPTGEGWHEETDDVAEGNNG